MKMLPNPTVTLSVEAVEKTSFRITGARVELIADQSTVAALFVDVLTGFVYGLTETTAKNLWPDKCLGFARHRKRLDAEREAFGRFIPEAERTWADIAKRYASR
jgi:hypothetical protein